MDFGTFFGTPFAESGDKVAIPVESQPSNAVSFTSGYTQDYSLNITTDPRAKSIGRTGQNYLFWAITAALGGLQRFGAPSWVGPDDNGGVPLAYPKGARVQEGSVFYVSLVANNTRALTDGTAWAVATFAQATNAEALAGTATDLLVTPATLRHVLQNTSIGQQATVTTAGVTRYATGPETQAGAVANAAVTPAGLKPALDAKANTLNPAFLGPISIQPAAGNFGAVELLRRTAGNTPGTKAFDYTMQPDGTMRISAYDAAGTNGIASVTVGPHSANVLDTFLSAGGDLIAGRNVVAAGRVQAGTLASETVSSTTRLATAAEMTAGATSVAASPGQIAAWVGAGYLPVANPRVSGSLRVSGIDGGLEFYNPTGNAALFYTEATGFDNTRFLFKTVPGGAAASRNAINIERATGRVTFDNGITVPTGQTIDAPAPTTTQPSTIRIATQTEVNAGTAIDIAVVPASLNGRLASYLPLNGGRMSGNLSVRSGDVGLSWRADNGVMRFYSNAEYLGNNFSFAYCNDDGSFRGLAYTINRTTGGVSFGSSVTASGGVFGQFLRSTSRADKKDIARELSVDEAIARVSAYSSYIGSWKAGIFGDATDTRPRPFFLADEVAKHAPELVSLDDDGVPGSVGYSDEMPSVMVVLQHLLRTVERLENEVKELRAKR